MAPQNKEMEKVKNNQVSVLKNQPTLQHSDNRSFVAEWPDGKI